MHDVKPFSALDFLGMMPAAETYDVVVIGAGAGGMTAAAVAAAEGLRVLLVEKTEFVGGTTAWSGGMVWIPANARMQQAGLRDSPTDAAAYLEAPFPNLRTPICARPSSRAGRKQSNISKPTPKSGCSR